MKPMLEETSISKTQIVMPATSGKTKLLAVVEVLLVYALVQALVIALRSTAIMQWEIQNLGWSYTGMLILVGIPAIVMWLGRRNWAEYGVSLVNWQTNLDIGIKAYLVAFIPLVFGVGGAMQLGLDPNQVSGGLFVVMMEVVGLALMV
jgi:hypothetical protein